MTAPSPSASSRALLIVRGGLWLLALLNLGRAVALWRQADWLTGLPIAPDPRWRLGISLVWAAALAVGALALGRRQRRARLLIPLLLAAHGVYELSMILRFASSPPAMLLMLIYAVFLGFAVWALWRPGGGHNISLPDHSPRR